MDPLRDPHKVRGGFAAEQRTVYGRAIQIERVPSAAPRDPLDPRIRDPAVQVDGIFAVQQRDRKVVGFGWASVQVILSLWLLGGRPEQPAWAGPAKDSESPARAMRDVPPRSPAFVHGLASILRLGSPWSGAP